MTRTPLFSIVLVMLVLGTVLVAGCAGDRNDRTTPAQPTAHAPPATHPMVTTTDSIPAGSTAAPATDMKSCAQLGGDICTAMEECSGSWLNTAKDSFSCCSKPCSTTTAAGSVITIETMAPSQTFGDLGSISP